MSIEQCEAVLDQVVPSLDIIADILHNPPREPWRNVSFLNDLKDNELCHILHRAKEEVGGTDVTAEFWDSLDIGK